MIIRGVETSQKRVRSKASQSYSEREGADARRSNDVVAKVRARTNKPVVIFKNRIFSVGMSDDVAGTAVFEQDVLTMIGNGSCSLGRACLLTDGRPAMIT